MFRILTIQDLKENPDFDWVKFTADFTDELRRMYADHFILFQQIELPQFNISVLVFKKEEQKNKHEVSGSMVYPGA